jgi:RNA polymerase sigma-70 factor (ECF subfamily)
MAMIPTVLGRVSNGASIRAAGRGNSAHGVGSTHAGATRAPIPATGPDAERYTGGQPSDGSLASASDHELLLAATASGSEKEPASPRLRDEAFAELYRRHKSEIYSYCLRMMGRDEALASDLFQDVFIRAYERAAQFRSGTNVRGWLYTIARNLCLNAMRSRQPVDSIELHPMLANVDRSLAPEYDEAQHFLRDRIERAVAELPTEYREAFVLREFDGFSYANIAEMTGTSLSVTKVRIWRAKERLRTLLQPYLAE